MIIGHIKSAQRYSISVVLRRGHLALWALLVVGCAAGEANAPSDPKAADKAKTADHAMTTAADPAFAADHAKHVAENPPGLSVTLRIDSDRKRFRMGEVVPIALSFTSTDPGRYQLGMQQYDRSGRMWAESFFLDPKGGSADPLASYFGQMRGGMGGIAALPKPIGGTPLEVRLEINEWVRFDKPGVHRLFVTTTRASDGNPNAATTNIIEIEIEDDPAWAAAELERIKKVLAGDPKSEAATKALRSLRFLSTAEATREIVAQMCQQGEQYVSDLHFGVHGARDRTAAIAELDAGLSSPTCAVSGDYLRTLAKLKMAGSPQPVDWQSDYREALEPSMAILSAAMNQKTPAARAVSTHAVLTTMREDEQRAGTVDPAAEKKRNELAALFRTLPDEARARILTNEWHTVRTPAMAPVLAALTAEARPRGGQLRSLSDLALERWLELDPKAARAFVLAELARPDGARVSFTGRTLSLLPDRSLPQLDAALVAGIRAPAADGQPVSDGATLELRAEVAARYASGAVVQDLWALYRASDYFRRSLLTYLVREDPAAARAELMTLTSDDLRRLAEIEWSAALQDAVIAQLQKPEPHLAESAAQLLGTFGDDKALPALWKRLRAINRTGLVAYSPEANLHSRIRQAIATGKGWLVTPKDMAPLTALCFDDECRSEVERHIERWNGGKGVEFVLWSHAESGGVTGWIAQYGFQSIAELKQKMLQLPPGTTLLWRTQEEEVERTTLTQVEQWAKQRGLVMSRQ